MTQPEPQWPSEVFSALRRLDVRQMATVPDAGLSRILELGAADPAITMVPLTTEEEGIGVLAGAWLGGQRGVLLMQSSGAGNCVNMLGLCQACRFPLLMVVTMRGEPGETNPWQTPMGSMTAPVLEIAGVAVHRVEEAAHAGPTVWEAGERVFAEQSVAAVLIAQKVIGFKGFDE